MNLNSERLGDWEQYLISLKMMLPYFAASGHRAYTKCLSLYLQEMELLDNTTKEAFGRGEWVIRRTDKAFAGVSVDLAIEQTLMASLKGNEGLTHGRLFNEVSSLIWLLSRPVVASIDLRVREMTHVDVRSQSNNYLVKSQRTSRIGKDQEDIDKIESYFKQRHLFSIHCPRTTSIQNIATGLVAPKETNVHKAVEIGNKILNLLVNKNPLEFEQLAYSS